MTRVNRPNPPSEVLHDKDKRQKTEGTTDRHTDRPTDRPTDKHTNPYRAEDISE